MGYALYVAQQGELDPDAKPLKGFGGAQVIEIVNRFSGNAYRAVYTVRFADALYVLHAFQKKSTKGVATPKPDMDLIRARLRDAERFHKEKS
jgi:phage-related protein